MHGLELSQREEWRKKYMFRIFLEERIVELTDLSLASCTTVADCFDQVVYGISNIKRYSWAIILTALILAVAFF